MNSIATAAYRNLRDIENRQAILMAGLKTSVAAGSTSLDINGVQQVNGQQIAGNPELENIKDDLSQALNGLNISTPAGILLMNSVLFNQEANLISSSKIVADSMRSYQIVRKELNS